MKKAGKTSSTMANELKKSNEELIKSEERFRLIVESVKDYAIFMLDPNGIVISWNEGARRLKGYEAQEIVGKHFSNFYPSEDVKNGKTKWEIDLAIREGKVEDEGWRIRKDGSRFWANVVITRINDESGNLIGFSKVTRDLTERRLAEEKLRASEERFRTMIMSVKDYAIFMLDPEGRVASWNEGARRIKGYEENEIIGKHFSKFYVPLDIQRKHPEEVLETARREGKYEEESWRIRKNGDIFWASVVITRLDNASGELLGFVKVTRDLTERKRHEEELNRTLESLERRVQERTHELESALAARDEFLSIASHELKTPLTTLKLQMELNRRRLQKEASALYPEFANSLKISLKQIDSLNHLVEDLLDVSTIQRGIITLTKSKVDLSELVEDVVLRFGQQLSKAECEVNLDLGSGITGNWDRLRLEQVLGNLLQNAIKYAPGKPLHIMTSALKDRARLVVEDSGEGIPNDKREIIFERFERLNSGNQISGIGLGLYITKKIIEGHDGSISVDSGRSHGARFTIELPKRPVSS